MMMNTLVIIPVCNPDDKFNHAILMLQKQSLRGLSVLIIDSGIKHEYFALIKHDSRFIVKQISNSDFNHGGTRQLGIDLYPDNDLYVFLTQDAVLVDKYTVEHLIRCFNDRTIGCAFGRQLPQFGATFFSKFARLNNYGKESYIRTFADRKKYGMKTCFISNSFAAYRKKAINEVGGFPTNTILSEDMYVAAKMLIHGWKIAYNADSKVFHSHNYSIWQEFKRYFDIGVFHSRENWIRENFGEAEGEGFRFIKKEIKAVFKNNPSFIIEMIVRDGMKYIGYCLGRIEKILPIYLKRYISMNKKYWG